MVCSVDKLPQGFYNSGVSTNSFILGNHSRLYQSGFNTEDWSGQLSAYEYKKGRFDHLLWQTHLDNPTGLVYSYNPHLSKNKGIKLTWDNLNKTQKKRLAPLGNEALARKRVNWLQGKQGDAISSLRQRAHYLADIIHSNITYKGRYQRYAYNQLAGDEGHQYHSFLVDKQNKQDLLLVSSNDGLLHAVNAETGQALFSYMAESNLGKIPLVSDPKYGCKTKDCIPHVYVADGLGSLGDAYFNKQWHSIFVNNLGIGGKGFYALDISDPNQFTEKHVLWEISTTQSPNNSEVFAKHLGYGQQQISIVRLQNGRWAAIVANGYLSRSQEAVLFIVDIETGYLIRAIETKQGGLNDINGLSAATSVDKNNDGSIDTVYAGDLQGNLWVFDLSGLDSSQWRVKQGSLAAPQPLFKACADNDCHQHQAITQAVEVGRHSESGLMVYFGTGYSDSIARLLARPQDKLNSLYGIRDQDKTIVRADLLKQAILYETNINQSTQVRIHSNNKINYQNKHGWYLDLDSSASKTLSLRESLYSQPVLHNGLLIINTVVEDIMQCQWERKSWLMRLNAEDGSRLGAVHFDINRDKRFSSDDNVDYNAKSTVISAIQVDSFASRGVMLPILRASPSKEILYVPKSKGNAQAVETTSSYSMGRQLWRKLR